MNDMSLLWLISITKIALLDFFMTASYINQTKGGIRIIR